MLKATGTSVLGSIQRDAETSGPDAEPDLGDTVGMCTSDVLSREATSGENM